MHIQFDFDRKAFGKRFRSARVQAGFPTQEKLAEVMAVTQKYISKIETGATSPSLSFILKFADLTGTDLNYLLLGHYSQQDFPSRLLKETSVRYGKPDMPVSKRRRMIIETAAKTLEELEDLLKDSLV